MRAAAATLPRDVASFTGRQGELARLAEAAAGAGGVVGIHAIGGMAGVGKTAFTVHAAHRLTDRYPGGQIFLPLHGHTPGRQPVEPADALVSLLLTIGVPAAQIPPGLEARMGLWRDRVASRQLCGFLPLAIGMVARQLRHHPAWSAAGRAAELGAARDRLELMETEDLSVTAAFNLSYADLAANQQWLFRRLGLHPGTDIDRYTAAALGGIGLAAARRGLEDLYDQYLLTEPAPGRYRMHDLIREHARASAARDDPAETSDAAVGRLLDYYQHAAARANAFIARQTRPDPAGVAGMAGAAGVVATGPAAVPVPPAHALNHLGTVWQQTGDYPAAARDLGEALAIFRDLGDRGGEDEALNERGTLHRVSGELAQAHALAGLGWCALAAGDATQAGNLLRQALEIFQQIGAAEVAGITAELATL